MGEIPVVADDRGSSLDQARKDGCLVAPFEDALAQIDGLIVSPGVPPGHPLVREAETRRVPIDTELSWACRHLSGEFWGVTGTNGKSTTVHVLASLLRHAGRRAVAAGNIGTPLAEFVAQLNVPEIFVCELSSFQIHYMSSFPLTTAIVLNVTPDHISWHGTFDAYRAAKLKIFRLVTPEGYRISHASVSVDGVLTYGRDPRCDLYVGEDEMIWNKTVMARREDLPLLGDHNWENTGAAMLACFVNGIDPGLVREGLMTLSPLPHRLETVARKAGRIFINDSKATNVDAVCKALTAFQQNNVWLIMGGKGKDAPYDPLRTSVQRVVCGLIVLGEDAPRIVQELGSAAPACIRVHTLDEAMDALMRESSPGDIVLLSPGCASFDQYRSFEERGNHFRDLVEKWPES